MMKKILLSSMLIVSCLAFSQEVKMKGEFVSINGNKCMKFKSKNMGGSTTFFSIDGAKVFYIDAGDSNQGENYFKIQFVGSDDIITLTADSFNYRIGFIKNMIEEGVINSNCQISLANIKSFKDRYHKDYNTTATTVIINNQSNDTRPRNGVNISLGR